MTTEDKLSKFIRRACRPATGYEKLMLVQVMTSGNSSVLRTESIDSKFGIDENKVGELVAEMLITAQEDADGHRGLTTYCLKVTKGVTGGERSPLFRLRAQESEFGEDEALGDTEQATKEGLLAQLMRHNEMQSRTIAQMFEVQARSNNDTVTRLSTQLTHYDDRHWETIMRAEELANEKDEREASRMLLASQEKRKDQALALLKPLVPIAMAKFKGTPDSAKPGLWMESIKSVLADISPEKMEKLAELLGPHSLALAELYMEAHKESDTNEQSSESGTH